jgi:hypothetical protein
MTGHEIRDDLSAYLDEALAPDEIRRVEAHLEGCAECRRELALLRQTVSLLHRVQAPRAPVGFVDRVAVAARPRPWYRRLAEAAFLPLSLKVPVEAAAVAMVALLAVYLFERTPELQQAARPEVARPGPATAARETPASPQPAELLADKTARPTAPAPAEAPVPAPAGGERDRRDARGSQVAVPAPASPPPVATAPPSPAAAPSTSEPPPAAKLEAPGQNVAGASAHEEAESRQVPLERSADSTRAAPLAPRPAAKRALPAADVVTRVAVKDRDAAERELGALIARVGGSVTQRRAEDEATIVEAVIPQARYAEFSESLARIGPWQVEAQRPDLPAQVRAILRLQ